jgi:tetratricopeptide (TPR) repeat protein
MKRIKKGKGNQPVPLLVGTRELEKQIEKALSQNDEPLAVQLLRRLLTQDSLNKAAHQRLIGIFSETGLTSVAIEHCEEYRDRHPESPLFHYLLATLLIPAGKTEEAMEHLDKCLELRPTHVEARIKRAVALERMTNYKEASEAVEALVKAGIKHPELDLTRGTIALHNKNYEESVKLTEPYVFNRSVPAPTRVSASYTCGKAFDKLGNTQKAMEALQVANTINKKPFDRDLVLSQVNSLKDYFTKEIVEGLPRATNSFEMPVFVAAMPRSGTTLLDQIMDAHPDAYGAGEIDTLDTFRFNIPAITKTKKPYPASLEDLTVNNLNNFSKSYIDTLKHVSDGQAKRVINKNLENYKNVPLMYMAFPKAKIIHIRRRAVDCALSIYMNGFNLDAYSYTSELKDIGFIWRQHERLMEHWMHVLPMPILDISYEDLVENPEEMTRTIIDFINLPWDDACLKFYQNKRTVMTPSYHQVAQPIYKSSVGQADKYKAYLGPMMEELEMSYPD